MIARTPGGDAARLMVLVVDDSPEDREAIKRKLTRAGHRVLEAEDAPAALAVCRQENPDCILLDYHLPEADGLELLAQMKGAEPLPPPAVCVPTGHGSERVAVEALRAGAQDYLSKDGLSPMALNHAIERAVERHRMQVRLARQRAELEQSNEEPRRFASVLSHDLRATVHQVRQFSELLVEVCPDLGEEATLYLESLREAAGRIEELFRALPAYARVTSERRNHVRVDLEGLARRVLHDLAGEIEAAGARVGLLPIPAVTGDETLLWQLLHNLVSNALKYRHPERPPEVMISGELDKAEGRVLLHVADRGIGFDPSQSRRIFEPFQRLVRRGEYPGTGMRLAICKRIAELHGGSIEATGSPGQGAVFTVRLPPSGEEVEP